MVHHAQTGVEKSIYNVFWLQELNGHYDHDASVASICSDTYTIEQM